MASVNQEVIDEITKSIQQISYGEVVVIIHNSKIVQIEKKEKRRFKTEAATAQAER